MFLIEALSSFNLIYFQDIVKIVFKYFFGFSKKGSQFLSNLNFLEPA